jgi:effector-binding domain-containing protein
MDIEVQRMTVAAQPTAVIRDRVRLDELSEMLIPTFDRVYAALPDAGLSKGGHNLLVMRGGPGNSLDIEVGIEVDGSFEAAGDLIPSHLPAGHVATAVNIGPYEQLGAVHDAIIEWCAERGYGRTGICWEIYGHAVDDAADQRTDVFYQLADRPDS